MFKCTIDQEIQYFKQILAQTAVHEVVTPGEKCWGTKYEHT